MADDNVAYRCMIVGYELAAEQTMRTRSECATIDDAFRRLAVGDRVTVARSDMVALVARLRAAGIGAETAP
jgi:hypothetical protein